MEERCCFCVGSDCQRWLADGPCSLRFLTRPCLGRQIGPQRKELAAVKDYLEREGQQDEVYDQAVH